MVELIVCALLASLIVGGRHTVDVVHGLKGTTPPHLEKARLKAKQRSVRSSYADGKPRLRDVAAVYWGDAMADVIASHERARERKQAAIAEGRTSLRDRMSQAAGQVREYARLVRYEGQHRQQPDTQPPPVAVPEPAPPTPPSAAEPEPAAPALAVVPDLEPEPNTPEETPMTTDTTTPTPVASPTAGEVLNYETAEAETVAAIERLRASLDMFNKALADIEAHQQSLADAHASYRPAAEASANIADALAALHVDAETTSHAATVADAVPANAVNEMIEQAEAAAAQTRQQRDRIEAALAEAEASLGSLHAKYGDANDAVQTHLGGHSEFLAGTGAAA